MAQSRIEAILENILGAANDILEPVSRNENLLLQISEKLDGQPGDVVASEEIDGIINTIN